MKTSSNNKNKLVYPPGCKEINDDLSTDDLIRRLKDISMAFQQLSQDDDNSQFIPLAMLLSTDFYLEHPSRDVRLLVACSIADVFRVYAPNAPYQHPDLIRKIFLFFIQQLRGLQDPKHATFKRYFYLLENLAWVKSFNICIELEDSQSIFCELFTLIFSIVNDNHSEKVKNFMVDMLTPLLVESDATSAELLEIILLQIIEPKKTQSKNACLLAQEIIKRSSKTLEPYLIAFLANSIATQGANPSGEDTNDEVKSSETGSSSTSFLRRNIAGVCDLIYELNRVCPSIMQDFLPQLEYKVKSNEEKERCEYTKLLARLFSDKDSCLDELYPDLWKSFLGRFRDISSTVRIRCVQYSMHFLVNHPEMKADVTEQLRQRQHDQDEGVRHEVVMAIISAAKKGIDNINEDLMSFVKERTLDKKFKIRREALYGMAQLYKQYVLGIKPEGPPASTEAGLAAVKMLNWIKNKCLHNYYQTSLEDKLLVERIVQTCLIPCSLPLEERMRVLYSFYATIDSHAARAFNEMLRQQQIVRRQVADMLEVIKEPPGPSRDALLKTKIQVCSRTLLEPVKTEEYITKFARNLETNAALRDHLELVVSSTSQLSYDDDGNLIPPPTSSTIEASAREILRSLGHPVQTNSFFMIIKNLMERIAPLMIDHDGLLQIFSYISDSLLGDGEMDIRLNLQNSAKRGLELVLSLSNVFPALFYGREPYNSYLLPFLWLGHANHQISELVLQILASIGTKVGLDPDKRVPTRTDGAYNSVPWWAATPETIPRLISNFILEASSPRQAKYAILCLHSIISCENEESKIYGTILDRIKDAGLTLDSAYFRVHLVALGMIAICGGQNQYQALLKSIISKFVVQGLLMKDTRSDIEIEVQEKAEKAKGDTLDFAQSLDYCSEEVKCKIEAIKLIVRWVHGMKLNWLVMPDKTDLQQKYIKNAQNALNLCKTMIQNEGDLNEKKLAGTTNEMAHLRLAAANAMLKIAANDSITTDKSKGDSSTSDSGEKSDLNLKRAPAAVSPMISPQQLHILATTLIDSHEFVRERFALKLHKKLISLELGLEFLAILSLGGTFDSESPFYAKLKRDLIKTNNAYLQALHPDCAMPYVIHLLAHMPFFVKYDDVAQLETVKECLWFIMEPMVLKNENYSFTFFKKTFESIKTCIDKQTAPEEGHHMSSSATAINYKIYSTCDLALGLVMSKTQNFLLKELPIKPQLHSKYYTRCKSAVENNLKSYLPEEMQFAPPKRCGLENEAAGKTTKKLKRN
ncbi:Sister chromatid cohesion protein PDS5-like B [Fragariocoptes setiger]|uniref:Sister chromatid cohesion protein PDS5-like B n=1 Tax=Fragariocoptes setiger TaxID=1670756 RepID=A0ABQ7S7F7_9ACAR|nr:Sister chromatid cohesion protein PDS5-like B [Fragariocoptes setiger]